MRRASSIAILAFSVLCSAVSQADEIAFSDLVGSWRAERTLSSGERLTAELDISSDKTFYSTVSVTGRDQWEVAGTVELRGRELTWRYLHSNRVLPLNATDTDTIISVDSQSFTYKSELNGEVNSYHREEGAIGLSAIRDAGESTTLLASLQFFIKLMVFF